MNDYQQMSAVINYLNEHYMEQPSLENLAQVTGLSPHHFQRKFTAWAGVSPKSFIQILTMKNARELLNQGVCVMDAAHASGLSGASRLHDLCVKLEAASPGDIKSGGNGMTLEYGFSFSPLGECIVAISSRGIVHLGFVEKGQQELLINKVQSEWPNATLKRNDHSVSKVVRTIFNNDISDHETTIRALVKGTKFQLCVWRALLQIEPGSLVTYGQLAASIGQPKASRAVGSAVGKNPLAFLIPCHRVIRGTGIIGNYRWGEGRKRLMITYESIHAMKKKLVT